MSTELVLQEDDKGCVPACVAMILGIPYAEAVKLFPSSFRAKGTRRTVLATVLRRRGLVPLYRPGLQKPFAPIHLVCVAWSRSPQFEDLRHCVIMTNQGIVLDPQGGVYPDFSRWPRVLYTLGILPIRK